MKKEYIIPETEIVSSQLEQAMLGHSEDWADAKENSFDEEEDTSFDRIKNLEFPHIWEDEDEE